MAQLYSATISANGTSTEISVTPAQPIGVNSDQPVVVEAKNAAGGESWALIGNLYALNEGKILIPPSPVIRIRAGIVAARVQVFDSTDV